MSDEKLYEFGFLMVTISGVFIGILSMNWDRIDTYLDKTIPSYHDAKITKQQNDYVKSQFCCQNNIDVCGDDQIECAQTCLKVNGRYVKYTIKYNFWSSAEKDCYCIINNAVQQIY